MLKKSCYGYMSILFYFIDFMDLRTFSNFLTIEFISVDFSFMVLSKDRWFLLIPFALFYVLLKESINPSIYLPFSVMTILELDFTLKILIFEGECSSYLAGTLMCCRS